jgi:hypothetical protein
MKSVFLIAICTAALFGFTHVASANESCCTPGLGPLKKTSRAQSKYKSPKNTAENKVARNACCASLQCSQKSMRTNRKLVPSCSVAAIPENLAFERSCCVFKQLW